MELLPRLTADRVRAALQDTPVVVVQGPRQAGKSTLVRDLLRDHVARYMTFDDLGARAAATRDPEGFIAAFDGPVVLDEVQRVPDLILAIKAAVDRDRSPGRFLLTGSADVFARSRVDDSLAGRRETVTLWTLLQSEIAAGPATDPLAFFDAPPTSWPAPAVTMDELTPRLLRGGYPEAVARDTSRRERWFAGYVDEIIRFEVADRSAIEQLAEIPALLRLTAARDTGLLNASNLATDLGVAPTTLRRYLSLLVEVFLVQLVPAWAPSTRKRLVKAPKVVITDSGLSAFLGGITDPAAQELGSLLESFVLSELRRLIDARGSSLRLSHFRIHGQHEVDAVLEDRRGRIVGIEVKSRTTLRSADFRGLRTLAEVAGERFVRGLILHPGREVTPHGQDLWAIPVSVLWSGGGLPLPRAT